MKDRMAKGIDIDELLLLEQVRGTNPDVTKVQVNSTEILENKRIEKKAIPKDTPGNMAFYVAKYLVPYEGKVDFKNGHRIAINQQLYSDLSKIASVLSNGMISPTAYIHNIITEHIMENKTDILKWHRIQEEKEKQKRNHNDGLFNE